MLKNNFYLFLTLLIFIFTDSCKNKENDKYNLVFFEKGNVKVGLLPNVGGRVIYLSLKNKPNIFKQDSSLWFEDPEEKPSLNTIDTYKPYHGHVVWPGPMKDCTKSCIYPDQPFMAAFSNNQLLIIEFPFHPRGEIHEEQCLVEIFNQVDTRGNADLLELEYHSAYQPIPPGKETSTWENWRVYGYNGKNEISEHLDFLNKIIKQ